MKRNTGSIVKNYLCFVLLNRYYSGFRRERANFRCFFHRVAQSAHRVTQSIIVFAKADIQNGFCLLYSVQHGA